jgi:hypothetical protein
MTTHLASMKVNLEVEKVAQNSTSLIPGQGVVERIAAVLATLHKSNMHDLEAGIVLLRVCIHSEAYVYENNSHLLLSSTCVLIVQATAAEGVRQPAGAERA